MKIWTKPVAVLLIATIMIFTSCIKRDGSFIPRANDATDLINAMAGKEIQFDSLTWNYNDNVDNAYIYIHRPDLFTHPGSFEVFLKPDTSLAWVTVTRGPATPSFRGFVYFMGSGALTVFPHPADVSVEGKIASVKLKF